MYACVCVCVCVWILYVDSVLCMTCGGVHLYRVTPDGLSPALSRLTASGFSAPRKKTASR